MGYLPMGATIGPRERSIKTPSEIPCENHGTHRRPYGIPWNTYTQPHRDSMGPHGVFIGPHGRLQGLLIRPHGKSHVVLHGVHIRPHGASWDPMGHPMVLNRRPHTTLWGTYSTPWKISHGSTSGNYSTPWCPMEPHGLLIPPHGRPHGKPHGAPWDPMGHLSHPMGDPWGTHLIPWDSMVPHGAPRGTYPTPTVLRYDYSATKVLLRPHGVT